MAGVPQSWESVSTWRQPLPPTASRVRRELIGELADVIDGLSPRRLRVALDGLTAAGKSTLGDELAAALRGRGRSTARASLDDFKHPWRHAAEHDYDRMSGAGYYRNAYDFRSAVELLLTPAAPTGSGEVVLCAHDPLTGTDHRDTVVRLGDDTVLLVDSVFALRSEYIAAWDYRIWVEVAADGSLRRGVTRDADMEGGAAAATRLHRDRYHAAEALYLTEVEPRALADVIVDNSDFDAPCLLAVRARATGNE